MLVDYPNKTVQEKNIFSEIFRGKNIKLSIREEVEEGYIRVPKNNLQNMATVKVNFQTLQVKSRILYTKIIILISNNRVQSKSTFKKEKDIFDAKCYHCQLAYNVHEFLLHNNYINAETLIHYFHTGILQTVYVDKKQTHQGSNSRYSEYITLQPYNRKHILLLNTYTTLIEIDHVLVYVQISMFHHVQIF